MHGQGARVDELEFGRRFGSLRQEAAGLVVSAQQTLDAGAENRVRAASAIQVTRALARPSQFQGAEDLLLAIGLVRHGDRNGVRSYHPNEMQARKVPKNSSVARAAKDVLSLVLGRFPEAHLGSATNELTQASMRSAE